MDSSITDVASGVGVLLGVDSVKPVPSVLTSSGQEGSGTGVGAGGGVLAESDSSAVSTSGVGDGSGDDAGSRHSGTRASKSMTSHDFMIGIAGEILIVSRGNLCIYLVPLERTDTCWYESD